MDRKILRRGARGSSVKGALICAHCSSDMQFWPLTALGGNLNKFAFPLKRNHIASNRNEPLQVTFSPFTSRAPSLRVWGYKRQTVTAHLTFSAWTSTSVSNYSARAVFFVFFLWMSLVLYLLFNPVPRVLEPWVKRRIPSNNLHTLCLGFETQSDSGLSRWEDVWISTWSLTVMTKMNTCVLVCMYMYMYYIKMWWKVIWSDWNKPHPHSLWDTIKPGAKQSINVARNDKKCFSKFK